MITYDSTFNRNEIAVISAVCIGWLVIFLSPKRFHPRLTVLLCVCGIYTGFLFDTALSVLPVSFYDVNDSSKLEIMDALVYSCYAPVSYLFFYIYDRLNVKTKFIPVYVLAACFVATAMEWVSIRLGVFHYTHHYYIGVSFTIYSLIFPMWIYYFHILRAVVNRESK